MASQAAVEVAPEVDQQEQHKKDASAVVACCPPEEQASCCAPAEGLLLWAGARGGQYSGLRLSLSRMLRGAGRDPGSLALAPTRPAG